MKRMRHLIVLTRTFLIFVGILTSSGAIPRASAETPRSPQEVLAALKSGNKRFIQNEKMDHDYHYQINATQEGQKPNAVVLSCLDSRVPVEIVFDQGIGDLFVARVAGNIENSDILGSLEFATQVTGAKLVVVLGHTKCGAVKGACQKVKLGHLTALLDKIEPAIKKARGSEPGFSCDSYDSIDRAAEENVRLTISRIRKESKVLRDLESQGKVLLVGAMYDVSTGEVRFL